MDPVACRQEPNSGPALSYSYGCVVGLLGDLASLGRASQPKAGLSTQGCRQLRLVFRSSVPTRAPMFALNQEPRTAPSSPAYRTTLWP